MPANNNMFGQGQGTKLRPLPIKENVYNEWGAVIKHQDEIDREIKRQQEEKFRERQRDYKLQLDKQYQEQIMNKKGSQSHMAQREEAMLKQYQRDLEEKQRAEDEKRNHVLNQQKEAALESINEMNIMKRQQQSIRDMERQLYYNKLKQQEELENKRRMEEKDKMKSDQENYSKILQMQHKSRLDQRQYEKQADRKFYEAEKEQLAKQDQQRNQFFEKLNRIQHLNDAKQKKLQEYMEQDPKEIRSKQDEINYIKNLEITEKNNQRKELEEKQKKVFDKVDNSQGLANQLKERELQKKNVVAQEQAIASYYMSEAEKYRLEVEDEKQRKQRQKEEYYKALTNQINENRKKKQYSVLMSEHEKRVNDRDIKAYQHQDTSLHSMVIGLNSNSPVQNKDKVK